MVLTEKEVKKLVYSILEDAIEDEDWKNEWREKVNAIFSPQDMGEKPPNMRNRIIIWLANNKHYFQSSSVARDAGSTRRYVNHVIRDLAKNHGWEIEQIGGGRGSMCRVVKVGPEHGHFTTTD